MTNCEQVMSKQSNAFVSFNKEIETQKQIIIDVEHKNKENTACMSKLKESLNMVLEMMNKENRLHEECEKELQKMKVLNSNMNHEMECVKKEHGLIKKELEESKTLNDTLQKKFTNEKQKHLGPLIAFGNALKRQLDNNNNNNASKLAEELKVKIEELNAKVVQLENQLKCNQKLELENQQLKGKLDVMKQMEDDFLKTVGSLPVKVMEKEGLLKDSKDLIQSLIIKERESNNEFQKARKKLIEGIAEISSDHGNICLSAKRRRYSKEQAEVRALEMCSLCQRDVEDPHWYLFKIITVDGKSKEIIDDEDETLKGLKKDLGDEAYYAVVKALKEGNEELL